MKIYLVGHDPAHLEEMRFKIANPTASLYNNRTQILAALEFACLDILGQEMGRSGLRHSRRQAADRGSVRVVSFLPLRESENGRRRGPNRSSSSSITRKT